MLVAEIPSFPRISPSNPCPPTLLIPLNQHHRPPINMPPIRRIIHKRKHDHRPIDQTTPIHRLRLDRHRKREKGKDIRDQHEEQRDHIHVRAETAHRPSVRGKGGSPVATDEDGADGDHVGGEEGADAERADGVERDGAADVDEGEEADEDEVEEDGVEGDGPVGVDLDGGDG